MSAAQPAVAMPAAMRSAIGNRFMGASFPWSGSTASQRSRSVRRATRTLALHHPPRSHAMNDTLSPRRVRALIALAGLGLGMLVLLLTPLSGHSEALGWTPVFWLLLAPASVLVAMKPGLP